MRKLFGFIFMFVGVFTIYSQVNGDQELANQVNFYATETVESVQSVSNVLAATGNTINAVREIDQQSTANSLFLKKFGSVEKGDLTAAIKMQQIIMQNKQIFNSILLVILCIAALASIYAIWKKKKIWLPISTFTFLGIGLDIIYYEFLTYGSLNPMITLKVSPKFTIVGYALIVAAIGCAVAMSIKAKTNKEKKNEKTK